MKLISDEEIVKPIKDSMMADILDGNRHLGRAIARAQLESCEQQAEEQLKAVVKKYEADCSEICTAVKASQRDKEQLVKAELHKVKAEIEKGCPHGMVSKIHCTICWDNVWKGKGIE